LAEDVLLPLGANLLVVDLGQGLLDGLDELGFVGARGTLECALDHVVAELVLDQVVEAGGAGDLLDVARACLLVGVGQTGLDRVRGELLDAQLIYLVDDLVVDSAAGLAVPVLQDLLDREVGKLVLGEFDHGPADLLQQSLPQNRRVRLGHYFFDDTQSVLINGQFIQVLVYFFEDEVWLVLLEDAALEQLLDHVGALLVHRQLEDLAGEGLPYHVPFFGERGQREHFLDGVGSLLTHTDSDEVLVDGTQDVKPLVAGTNRQ
jgi:hypothetical protein